jgi:DNA-3-methyladenine glycosylase II
MEDAYKHFKRADPILYKAARSVQDRLTPQKLKRTNQALFASLAESVVSQQLSVKAADTIFTRLTAACGGSVTPDSILAASLPKMRKAGLSAAKAKTLKELSKAVKKGLVLSSLRTKSPEEATEALVEIWGIGPWTAEMFLLFGLGHPDIFSPGDLGLVRSIENLYGIKNPSRAKLESITACWSPHRSLACRILWRYRDTV